MESGLELPDADLVIDAGAIVASAIVGIGTTLVASVGPAIKASRVPPLAALRDVAVDRSGTSVRRAVIGVVVAGAGQRRPGHRHVDSGDRPRPRRARVARRCSSERSCSARSSPARQLP